MVFTSIPVAYLDAANWQQQQPNHQQGNNNSTSQQLLLPPRPPPRLPATGSNRLGPMAVRARMENVPRPKSALKCPRCGSTNTKFCYYNNYKFSQERHICKNCSRYWTKDGALRDIPVGGGYGPRNKRNKGGSSSASSNRQRGSAASLNSGGGHAADILGLAPQMPPMMFMAPLHHHHQFSEFGSGDMMGLNYGLSYDNPISGPMAGEGGGVGDLSFQIGSAVGGGRGGTNGGGVLQTEEFPFLAGSPGGLYHHPFEGSDHHETIGYGGGYGVSNLRQEVSTSGLMTQLDSVNVEDSNRELNNLPSQFLGTNNIINPPSEQYGSNNPVSTTSAAWTDHISSFT